MADDCSNGCSVGNCRNIQPHNQLIQNEYNVNLITSAASSGTNFVAIILECAGGPAGRLLGLGVTLTAEMTIAAYSFKGDPNQEQQELMWKAFSQYTFGVSSGILLTGYFMPELAAVGLTGVATITAPMWLTAAGVSIMAGSIGYVYSTWDYDYLYQFSKLNAKWLIKICP